MYQIYITPTRITSATATDIVVTLLGLKEVIAQGKGPGVIDKLKLTPRAAEYWADYKSRAFPNEKNKSYPLD